MGVREKNKQVKRDQILAAAVRLLERGGSEGLTMRKLSRAAGVAEMTPYNLFGSKAGVIAALFETTLARVVERSFEQTPTDPLERLFVSAEVLADAWIESSGLFRQLVRCARESGADLTRFADRPISLLQAGLVDVAAAGLITEDVPLAELARYIFIANQGAYEPWLTGEIDDAALRRDLIIGLSISLLAVATPATRKRILARLSAARRYRAPKRRRPRTR